MSMPFPYLAVPTGDPAGIGSEIVLKVLADGRYPDHTGIVFVSDAAYLAYVAKSLSIPWVFDAVVEDVPSLSAAMAANKRLILLSRHFVEMDGFSFGRVSAMGGQCAYDSVALCVDLVQKGLCRAIVTPPLHKGALKAAGIDLTGYTEILAHLAHVTDALTMFDTDGLKIFFHSRHMSLIDACRAVTEPSLSATIRRCYAVTERHGAFDHDKPLAVAALNPHAGDGGLFGDEEMRHIIPAIERTRAEGLQVVGPIGADSVFHQAKLGMYRAVVSLYHDQGHIAAKTLDFDRTISLTWGLPFLRTSVDHGTAFDIAGKGIANSNGMEQALAVAHAYLSTEEL